jgi:hypothetical protein
MDRVERPMKRRAGLPLCLAAVMTALAALALPGAAHAQWASSGTDINNTNSGNVGVGSGATSPPFLLTVAKPSTDTDPSGWANSPPTLFLRNTSSTANNYSGIVFGNSASTTYFTSAIAGVNEDHTTSPSGHLSFFTKNAGAWAERLRITAAGNVGLGTTTPTFPVTVNKDGSNVTGSWFNVAQFDNAAAGKGVNLGYDNVNGNGVIASPGTAGLAVWGFNGSAWGERLRVTGAGNFGVGTASPAYVLHVEGASTDSNNYVQGYFKNTSADRPYGGVAVDGQSQSHVRFMLGGAVKWQWRVGAGTGVDDLRAYSWTLGQDVLTLKNNGSVGVGTATPNASYKLDVNGAAHVGGDMAVDGNIAAKYQDVAEWVPSSQKLSAGTVVVLDTTQANHVQASTLSYDTSVAGVVSAQPGITLGQGGEGKVLVATTGRVRVKVNATHAPIRVGDLLVTSDLPGTAMKSEPVVVGGRRMHAPGTIIGKALESLDGGTGEILVLLCLQ